MLIDGAYSDATYRDGVAGLGVVLIGRGVVASVTCRRVRCGSSHEAELAGVALALKLHPDAPAHFTDSTGAAAQTGAVWIPRKLNERAHLAAHGIVGSEADEMIRRTADAGRPRRKKKAPELRRHKTYRKARPGGGCVAGGYSKCFR